MSASKNTNGQPVADRNAIKAEWAEEVHIPVSIAFHIAHGATWLGATTAAATVAAANLKDTLTPETMSVAVVSFALTSAAMGIGLGSRLITSS